MKYTYPVLLTPLDAGMFHVDVPDLPGCMTEGRDLTDALVMAQDALAMWLWDAENKKEPIPPASITLKAEGSQIASYVVADTDEYRKSHDNRAVKKTLTIPSWLNAQAEEAGMNFSGVLQEALKEKLKIS